MADHWILSKVNTLAKDVTENMDKYELGIALQKVYDFIWEGVLRLVHRDGKAGLWSEEDTTKAAALWTLKTVLIQSSETAASIYAVHHRGNLLQSAG